MPKRYINDERHFPDKVNGVRRARAAGAVSCSGGGGGGGGGEEKVDDTMGSAGSKRLPKEDMDFLMQNTNFTKQQIKAWYNGFMVGISRSVFANIFRIEEAVNLWEEIFFLRGL